MSEVKAKVIEFGDLIGALIGAAMGYAGGFIGLIAGGAGGYFIAKELLKGKEHSSSSSSSTQPKYRRV